MERGEDGLGLAEGGVEGGLVAGDERGEVDGGDGGFDGGEEIFAGRGEYGEKVGGGDALNAEVVGVGAGAGRVGDGFDAEIDAGELFIVDGVEEFDGDEDLVAGPGGLEEDDGFEVFAEGDALAVEVDDLGDGAVGVGLELEEDAGAGDVVAVEGLGDFDGAAVPDGLLGALECGLTICQDASSSEGDSPWGMSPGWKRQSPGGRALRVSRVWSLARAEGERFFCSRTGVKDCAVSAVVESSRASGRARVRMSARVANRGMGRCICLPSALVVVALGGR